MRKIALPLACGVLLAAGCLAAAIGRAESIPRATASRIINLTPPVDEEKTPVISSVAIDQAGRLLAAVGDDHLVRVFDAQSGELVHRWKSHTDWVKASAFQPDGQLLATSGADRRICLWATAADGQSHDLSESPQVIYTLVYSPDGRMLAAAGFDDKVWMFDAESGQLLRELAAPGSDIRAISFSPDGTRMAAAGRAGLVRIWEAAERAASGRRAGLLAADLRLGLFARRKTPGRGRPAAHRAVAGRFDGQALGRSARAAGRSAVAVFLRARHAGLGRQRQRDSSLGRGRAQEKCRLVGHTGSITTLVYRRPDGNADFRQLRHDRPPVGH